MPPNTRASAISATAAEKLENDRVPGRTSESIVNGVLSPNIASRINAAAPLTVECPDGYSGCGGVPVGRKSSHGVHIGSASVLGVLVSIPGPNRGNRTPEHIAILGIPAGDASVCHCEIKQREQVSVLRNSQRTRSGNLEMRFQYRGVLPFQNNANSDWSAERRDPVNAPIILISL